MLRFGHSGKMGDILYALPAVAACAPAELYLRPGLAFGEHEANLLMPLLRAQPYLSRVTFGSGAEVDVNLDRFRQQDPENNNLVDCHLRLLGLPGSLKDRAWLSVGSLGELPAGTVLFGRSLHHVGIDGFWEACMDLFGERALFVGTEEEHGIFCKTYGQIPYRPTRDMLELAGLIKQAALFVGNQSCPYAIAEGLKRPTVQHVFLRSPNCVFDRPDSFYVRGQADLDGLSRWWDGQG